MISNLYSWVFSYISAGTNISLNNKNGIRWGYEITGGAFTIGFLHLKMSYGKKYFNNLTQHINYYTFGGGISIFGYERGTVKIKDGQNKIIKGKRSNIYLGGFIYPVAMDSDDVNGMIESSILPTNFILGW